MDIAEKRVYEERAGRTKLALATDVGLAIVGISGDVIGEFGLAVREPMTDLAAAGDGRLLAAAADDVLLVELAADSAVAGTERVVETGGGGADAVAVAGGSERATGATAISAGSDGVVRQVALDEIEAAAASDADETPDWTPIGDADVRAADGRLLATPDGVYRVGDGGPNESASVDHVGLDDARDVAATGPLAATGDGLFRLGPGWTEERSGAFDVVAAASAGTTDSAADAAGLHAHAAAGASLYERQTDAERVDDAEWTEIDWPVDAPVAGVAYGEGLYAAARDGTVLANAGDGWRTRSVGLADVRSCAVVR